MLLMLRLWSNSKLNLLLILEKTKALFIKLMSKAFVFYVLSFFEVYRDDQLSFETFLYLENENVFYLNHSNR